MTVPVSLPSLATERLILAPPAFGEETALADAINSSLDTLRPWTGISAGPKPAAWTQALIARARDRIAAGCHMQWWIRTQRETLLLGTVLVHEIDPRAARAEVGFWLRTSAVGRGYATEAVHRVLHYLLVERGFARVEVRCDLRNARAIAVATRLRLAQEGILQAGADDAGRGRAGTIVFAICSAADLQPLPPRSAP